MKNSHPVRANPAKQSGVMLLEALIALLIFSVGILAIVGMQASAFQDMGEAKYRSDAAFLANQVIAEMWSNANNLADYVYDGTGAPPKAIENWVATVQTRLPGATANPPVITRDAATNAMTVIVSWQQARDHSVSAPAHSYRAVAYINVD
jgi:type IV pilus assembly protein PilV